MNRPRSTRRFSLPASLCLALCLYAAGATAEVPLRAFSASYEVYKGGFNFATAELSLAPLDDGWRWRLVTRARGIFTMLYDKEAYSETKFDFDGQELRLREIVLADEDGAAAEDYEFASFDWNERLLKVLRKGERRELALSGDVYDYQSIHLLAASMQQLKLQRVAVSFYRKGKLIKSQLAYLGEETLDIDGKEVTARVYDQTIKGSSTISRYFYEARNPLLPIRIETRKGDDSPMIFRLGKVEWTS